MGGERLGSVCMLHVVLLGVLVNSIWRNPICVSCMGSGRLFDFQGYGFASRRSCAAYRRARSRCALPWRTSALVYARNVVRLHRMSSVPRMMSSKAATSSFAVAPFMHWIG